MRKHHALGEPGGAGGEKENGRVFFVDRGYHFLGWRVVYDVLVKMYIRVFRLDRDDMLQVVELGTDGLNNGQVTIAGNYNAGLSHVKHISELFFLGAEI